MKTKTASDMDHAQGMASPPASYFLPEAREGFYVSDMMKRYWAGQIRVLEEIAAICKRHAIPWFADNGSLLGAVRHGGYIPWDDDFDIAMLRHDLKRFLKAAEEELPDGYVILDLQHEEEYTLYLTRIVNARTIDFSEAHLADFYGCPFTVGVDIFPLDGLYEDEEKEEARRQKAQDAVIAARLISEGKRDLTECRERLARLEKNCGRTFGQSNRIVRELLLLAEELFAECDSETATHLAMMPFWAEYHNHRYDREWYRYAVQMPFEYITLPVPACYNEILKTNYGDYMRVVKAGGLHDYPVYHDQEVIFREKTGKNPWRYTFDKQDLRLPERTLSRKEKIRQMTEVLTQAKTQIEALLAAGNREAAEQLAAGCEQVADTLKALAARKREVVFLAVKAAWWPLTDPFYREAVRDETCEVTVIAVPYLESEPDGRNPRPVDESAFFPADLPLTKPSAYDFGARHPDTIVTQSPYDAECNAVMLPEFFHAKNLRAFTDCLRLIPCHDCYTPEEADGKARAALKVLTEQPGVICADEVVVADETMRMLYVETLTALAGDETRGIWEEKIVCSVL